VLGPVLGIVILSVFNSSLDSHLTGSNIPAAVLHVIDIQRSKLVGIVIPAGVSDSVQTALERAIAESFVAGFRVVMLIASALAVASALSALLLIEGKSVGSTSQPVPGEGSAAKTLRDPVSTKDGEVV
jgi:hypothetical protein